MKAALAVRKDVNNVRLSFIPSTSKLLVKVSFTSLSTSGVDEVDEKTMIMEMIILALLAPTPMAPSVTTAVTIVAAPKVFKVFF